MGRRKNLQNLNEKEIEEYLLSAVDRYLSYRPRTEYELRLYIDKKLYRASHLSEEQKKKITETVMSMLDERGHVDDEGFAAWYVEEKQYFKPRGSIRIRQELRKKGLEENIIEEALLKAEKTDKEVLHELINKKYLRIDISDKSKERKFIQKLQRKGFPYATIRSSIEELIKKE